MVQAWYSSHLLKQNLCEIMSEYVMKYIKIIAKFCLPLTQVHLITQ